MINVVTDVSQQREDHMMLVTHTHKLKKAEIPDKNDYDQKADASTVRSLESSLEGLRNLVKKEIKTLSDAQTAQNSASQSIWNALNQKEQELQQAILRNQEAVSSQLKRIRDAVYSGEWLEATFKDISQTINGAEEVLDARLKLVNESLHQIQIEKKAIEDAKAEILVLVQRIERDAPHITDVFVAEVQNAQVQCSALKQDLSVAVEQISQLQQYANHLQQLRTDVSQVAFLSKIGFWKRLKWLCTGQAISEIKE